VTAEEELTPVHMPTGDGGRPWQKAVLAIVMPILLAAVVGTLLWRSRSHPWHGQPVRPVQLAPDFLLTNQDGQPTRLSDFRGRVVMIFFGYTYCPDVCPTTLATLKLARAKLSEAERPAVQVIFISVDPERDTPELLNRYLAAFDPSFVGLTGEPDVISATAKAYGVFYQKEYNESGTGYLVTHSALTYAIDKRGQLVRIYPYNTSARDFVADLRRLIKQ